MQRPVTVSRTCGKEARQSRSSSSPNGTSTPASAAEGGPRSWTSAASRSGSRGGRRARRSARPRAKTTRAGRRSSPSGVSGRTSVRHSSSARRPARQLPADAREVGLGGRDERERRGEARKEPAPQARRQRPAKRRGHGGRDDGLGREERGGERDLGPGRGGEREQARWVDRLALEHAAEVEPLHEREHEAVLEGGVQRELQQQVLGRGQAAELAAAGAAPRPQAFRVEREEAGGGDDAAVQLHDPAAARVAEGPRVVAARHLGEARLAQRLDPLRPALEREHVHVRHRPVRLDVVDGLREDRPLQGQAADAARLEEPEGPRGEADLAERPHEVGAAAVRERRPRAESPTPAGRARSRRAGARQRLDRVRLAPAPAPGRPPGRAGRAPVAARPRSRPRAFDSAIEGA